jgi:hypothetical protein
MEDELPTALVKNKVACGIRGRCERLSILAQYEMTRHGHRKLAWLGRRSM